MYHNSRLWIVLTFVLLTIGESAFAKHGGCRSVNRSCRQASVVSQCPTREASGQCAISCSYVATCCSPSATCCAATSTPIMPVPQSIQGFKDLDQIPVNLKGTYIGDDPRETLERSKIFLGQ